MDQTAEKSCWSVTLWTLGIVLAAVVLAALLMGSEPVDAISAAATVSS